MVRKADLPDHIIDKALELAARDGWGGLRLSVLADAAGVSVADVWQTYSSKSDILAAYAARLDQTTLAAAPKDLAEQPVRDRLFDLIMRRLDAMAEHKEAVRSIARDVPRDPIGLCCASKTLGRSMRALLAGAGLASDGVAGMVQAKGLAAIYVGTLRVWMGDDSEDSSRTMAALDKRLRRADQVMAVLCRIGRRRSSAAPADAEEAPQAG